MSEKSLPAVSYLKIPDKLMRGNGRILVRKSGTESKIRVMCESENKRLQTF